MKTTVSVITTIYNAENFLAPSLNSVLSQVITDEELFVEYIIVNDCTPDNSMSIVDHFVSEHKNDHIEVKIFNLDKNVGCGGARKYGIEHSTGDFLMFLDADDYYMHVDFIQRAVTTIKESESDMVEFGVLYNYNDGKKVESVVNKRIEITNTEQAIISIFKNNIIKFHVWTKIIRRNIIEQYSYSDQRTFEDVVTTPIWVSLCKKIIAMPCIEINYRATQNSIIREKILNTRLGTVKAIASNFERFKHWPNVLKSMYGRAMIDLSIVLNNNTSKSEGFNEMSRLNTYMLSYIMPDEYQNLTYNIEDGEK